MIFQDRTRRRISVFVEGATVWIVLLVACIFTLFPIFWTFLTSLKNNVDLLSIPPKWVFNPTLVNYYDIIFGSEFRHYFINSLVVDLSSTALSLIVGVPAAYVLARFSFRGKSNISFWVLTIRMAPPITVLIPFFVLFKYVGLFDTYPALIIMYLTINLPLIIWMMRSFVREVPSEIDEAALVDGCSRFTAFWRVILPVTAPGISAAAILSFLFSWNEFLFALVLTGANAKTAPVGISGLLSYQTIIWGRLGAAGILTMIPVIVLTLAVQKQIIRGLTFGAVKG